MTQRVCEVCADPLPEDWDWDLCENCQTDLENEEEATEEEVVEGIGDGTCETSAPSVVVSSSSVTLEETSITVRSTSESSDARSAESDMEFASLASATPSSEASQNSTEPTKDEKLEECESCGARQKTLKVYKHPLAKDSIAMCDKCYASELAVLNHTDDPMQGKVVHPDEASREEIITMDDEDKVLYNEEVLIAVSSPIEDVYARIVLLDGKLKRAKLQLKAARTTLFMRIEGMRKEESEAEYKRLNELDATRRRKAAPVGVTPKAKGESSGGFSSRSRRTKTEQFIDAMRNNGFPEDKIQEMVVKMGIKD